MQEEEKKLGIIDLVEGVILSEFNSKDKIIRNASIEAYSKLHEDTISWKYDEFSIINNRELRKITPELSVNEMAMLFAILPYVDYTTCLIRYSNGREIKIDQIAEITGMKRRRAIDTLHSLIEKKMLYKGQGIYRDQYFINPWLMSKGNRIHKGLFDMFKDYVIKTKGKTWEAFSNKGVD